MKNIYLTDASWTALRDDIGLALFKARSGLTDAELIEVQRYADAVERDQAMIDAAMLLAQHNLMPESCREDDLPEAA